MWAFMHGTALGMWKLSIAGTRTAYLLFLDAVLIVAMYQRTKTYQDIPWYTQHLVRLVKLCDHGLGLWTSVHTYIRRRIITSSTDTGWAGCPWVRSYHSNNWTVQWKEQTLNTNQKNTNTSNDQKNTVNININISKHYLQNTLPDTEYQVPGTCYTRMFYTSKYFISIPSILCRVRSAPLK